MIEINEITARTWAAKAGLPLQFVVKERYLFDVLSKVLDVNKGTDLKIIMKGGTALNKAYFKGIQRFSEDIDFDCFSKEKDKITTIKNMISTISEYTVEGPWKLKDTLRFHFNYLFAGRKDNIRVEFSLNKKLKTTKPLEKQNMISEVTDSSIYRVPVYAFDDLVARKMNALRVRAEGKDIWDCYHAIPKTKDLKKAITTALKSEDIKLTVEEALEETLKKLETVDAKQIMKLTDPYIPTSLRPKHWEGTVEDLIRMVKNMQEK